MKDRDHEIHVRMTKDEIARIRQRMVEAGVRNQSAFVRKMILDGYIVKLDMDDIDKMIVLLRSSSNVPFPVSWTVKMKKKQKETQDILSYHTQAAGCSDKARAKASGGRQPIEECGRTGL